MPEPLPGYDDWKLASPEDQPDNSTSIECYWVEIDGDAGDRADEAYEREHK